MEKFSILKPNFELEIQDNDTSEIKENKDLIELIENLEPFRAKASN